MTFREAINLSVKADGSTEYPAKFIIEVEGESWHCHTVSIAHRDILCFCDKGTATFLVDSYGDRHVAELFNWEHAECFMTMPWKIHDKRLVTFASKDPHRFHLCSIHRAGEKLVSIDGHRLYMCDVEAAGPIGRTAIDGKTYCSTAWNADALKEIDCTYPNIDVLIPSPGPDMTNVTVSIPAWIGKVKAVRGTGLPILGIMSNGNFCFGSNTTGRLTNVNAELIAPLAGETCVWWFKDHLSPILVVPTEKEAKWKAVIMPIRA